MRNLLSFVTNTKEGSALYTLSKEGIQLVESIKKEHTNVSTELLAIADIDPIKIAVEEEIKDDSNVDSWIDQWLDIFPIGVRSGGKPIRGDKINCARKMKVFINEYKYTKDIIMRATRNYIEAKRQTGWAYTRCAVYFIFKMDKINGKTSDLAAECEQVVDRDAQGNTENNLEIMA